jgi:hypothetical protein
MSDLTLLGFEHLHGKSKKTGNTYDMIKLSCCEPIISNNGRGQTAIQLFLADGTKNLSQVNQLKLPCKIVAQFTFTSGQPRFTGFDLVKE